MARDTAIRYTLTGKLICQTPLHIGGIGDDPDTDLPLARDGRGRCYIPGTSLTGALRQWCGTAFGEQPDYDPNDPDDPVNHVWGYQVSGDSEKGDASHITVDDLFVDEKDLIPEVRDGVGIDRETGAAARHIKYDRAILPRGTQLKSFTVTAEVPGKGDAKKRIADPQLTLAMLAGLKEALTSGRVRLGAAKTRGLGKVNLEGGTLRQVETNTRMGLLQILRGEDSEIQPERLAAVPAPHELPRLDIVIDWEPDGPLMVKAGYDGIAADMLPLVSGKDGGIAPVLPGSSIKGAFRTRAEQIVCTLLNIEPSQEKERKKFLDDTGVPLVDELFGARGGIGDSRDSGKKVRGQYRHGPRDETRLGLGAVAVDDCYATAAIATGRWESVVTAGEVKSGEGVVLPAEANLRSKLSDANLDTWQQAFHVAIDRWTGGAAESFLYTVLEPHGVAWEPIALTIDLHRLPAGLRSAAAALLLLVVRDLATGRLPLGFAVNRGMGSVKVRSMTVRPHEAGEPWGGQFELKGDTFAGLPPAVRTHLNAEWQAWLRPNREASR